MLPGGITTALTCLCLAYIGYTIWTMYHIYHVEPCVSAPNRHCLPSWLFLKDIDGKYKHENLAISIYGSSSQGAPATSVKSLYQRDVFNFFEVQELEVNVSLPEKVLRSGKYYLHMYLHTPEVDPLYHQEAMMAHVSVQLTQLSVPKTEAFNLVSSTSDEKTQAKGSRSASDRVPHWRSRVMLSVMTDDISLDAQHIPPEIFQYIKNRVDQQTSSYLPIALEDKLSFRLKHLEKLDKKTEMPLTIIYQPMGVGKLKLWSNFEASFHTLGQFGFGEAEIDEVKGIFVDTNFFLLLMTVVVSALHILFDTLAFKNDITYWRNRKSMVGLSSRAVVWRCVSTFIIFGYLLDADTSLLVTVPTGISAIIETWKLKKALKISFHLSTRPISFGAASDKERETEQFDAAAMGYLAYILYPLLIAGAIYSLLYTPHKSWWSWGLQSLVNGVYAFGFLFMLPQLFVNYKLKSVAHLPWRAFMYKAFNTFIDDVFAFIITMPNAHRLACFRDDVVFVIYLIQRWQYPVDKSRVNEFGQSFEDADSGETKKTK